MPAKRISLADRLAQNVVTVLPSGCDVWVGYVDDDGYAIACMSDVDGKKNRKVHRLVYEAHHGPIPKDMMVCHRCDVRSCVNPDHLFLGSAADNVADMWAKGRWRPGAQDNRGQRNPRARLAPEDVSHIRAKRAAGVGPTELADIFGVTRSHIQRICSGKMWAQTERGEKT
jgi:hypothetical protein